MKLLLDENLSRRLVPFLQHDYPGSSQVVLLGLESASDAEVWQAAKDRVMSLSRGMPTSKSFHWYGDSPPR